MKARITINGVLQPQQIFMFIGGLLHYYDLQLHLLLMAYITFKLLMQEVMILTTIAQLIMELLLGSGDGKKNRKLCGIMKE